MPRLSHIAWGARRVAAQPVSAMTQGAPSYGRGTLVSAVVERGDVRLVVIRAREPHMVGVRDGDGPGGRDGVVVVRVPEGRARPRLQPRPLDARVAGIGADHLCVSVGEAGDEAGF